MNSTELLNEIEKQLKLLERKDYDKRSFQAGYLLGYAKAIYECANKVDNKEEQNN